MNQADKIITDLKKGNIKPLYLLTGDEPYYIDQVSNHIAENLLDEAEKSFNQLILYGKDTSAEDIVSHAKRFPMMAERQVVIVKEAQELARTIDKLLPYCENPQPTTVLVLCYKYKALDKRKKLYKTFKKNGVVLEEKKMYDNKVADWIVGQLKAKGYSTTPKAAMMLVEFLGNDLSKIANELDKLTQVVQPGQPISPELIEENIGISKDFNNFELQSAIGSRDVKKAFRIARYFAQNPKNNPLMMTLALLYSFFSKVMRYHALANKSDAPKALGISPYFVKDYQLAARNYPMKKVSANLALLRQIDLKSKGVGATNLSQSDLLNELLTGVFE